MMFVLTSFSIIRETLVLEVQSLNKPLSLNKSSLDNGQTSFGSLLADVRAFPSASPSL